MNVFPPLCLAAALVVACGPAESTAQARAGAQASGARPAPSSPAAPANGPIVLEFDLPADFQPQPAGSADGVTGFRLGYFSGADTTAIRTVDFARDALTVQGRTARVTLPREPVPGCAGDCAIRVQTLSRAGSSAWSEPVPLAGRAAAPVQAAPPKPAAAAAPRAARTDRPRNAPAQERRGLTPGDIEGSAALSEALRKLLPPDASLEAELQRFGRVSDLALAVVISRDYDIPFTTLSRTLAGPPRLTVRNALIKLRPDVDVRSALRKSRAEAGRLTKAPTGGGNAR